MYNDDDLCRRRRRPFNLGWMEKLKKKKKNRSQRIVIEATMCAIKVARSNANFFAITFQTTRKDVASHRASEESSVYITLKSVGLRAKRRWPNYTFVYLIFFFWTSGPWTAGKVNGSTSPSTIVRKKISTFFIYFLLVPTSSSCMYVYVCWTSSVLRAVAPGVLNSITITIEGSTATRSSTFQPSLSQRSNFNLPLHYYINFPFHSPSYLGICY